MSDNSIKLPSLLVLPIAGGKSNAVGDYFSAGLTEDIVSGLSLSRWLMVFNSGTTFSFLGTTLGHLVIATQLGADYVVHGRVRQYGPRIRAIFYLTDVDSGAMLWTRQFDCKDSEIFDMEDEIKHSVLTAIEPETLQHQTHRECVSLRNLDQWKLVMKAREYFWQTSRDSTHKARALVEQAIAMQHNDVRAWGILAMTHLNDAWNGWAVSRSGSLRLADETSRQAVQIDAADPWAQHTRAALFGTVGRFDDAEAALELALSLSPYFAPALGDMTRIRVFSGRIEGAAAYAERAIIAGPRDPHVGLWYYWIALALFVDHEYAAVIPYLDKALKVRPDWIIFNRLKVVCLVLLGDIKQANALLGNVTASHQEEFIRSLKANHPFRDNEPLDRYCHALSLLSKTR